MLEFLELFALLYDLDKIAPAYMHRIARRRHLQFDCMQPKLLDRPGAADAAIADKGSRFAVPFGIGIVKRVLQHCGGTTVVFGSREDETIELGDLLLPALGLFALRGHIERGTHLIEKGQR